ncbi:protein kinase domain-containing protein [Mesoterricola silvestris]|uniref:Protein kinase domain-containing protein n=1 Tax=Mesoterricola silvestris TaxID=2927979 RepID=A0AA48GN75_9BACT|nr:protein kinase [Mesoterricola silvestris]BDU74502.1 hypothetical protein METEAL_36760 [Mesoterricola silvestris]
MIKTIGKFEIVRLLGRGNMGEVYLGRDPVLDRPVAVKTIRPGTAFEGEGQARFEREARAMAALNHPNIITIYDFGMVEELCYLAMEFHEGDDLATLIQRGAPSRAELLEALAQACDGLGFAHARGIVHRDFKPANILVGGKGKRPVAKLLDFGVASVDRSSLTEQGTWMGTVSYMAPEYLESGKAGPAADIFAAGVIIFEILSGGDRPFTGEGPTAILNAILHKPPRELAPDHLAGIPGAVVDVMKKALSKDPAQRHATAEDLASDLRRALAAPLEAPLPPQRIVVGKGGGATCLSIRVALRQARSGAVIEILPGVYREAVVVDKELTLQGSGDASLIVVESAGGPCLTVDAPRCEVRGLTLRGGGPGPAADLRSGHTTLEAALVTSPPGLGLRLHAGAQATGVDCVFEDHAGGSVELGPRTTSRFVGCEFIRSGSAGVLALEGARVTLEYCKVSDHAAAGVHAAEGALVELTGCRITGNAGLGLCAVDGGRVVLKDCEVSGNGQPGLLLHRGGAAQLSSTRVVDGASMGIACHLEAALAMDHCLVRGNAPGGLLLAAGSLEPVLGEGNTIEDAILR